MSTTRSSQYSGGFPSSLHHFHRLKDPRKGRHKRHYFGEIIFIALAAIICKCEGFDDMERFAQAKESWLRKFLKLPHGAPSDDTFRRVFTAIDPKEFNQCFIEFVNDLHPDLGQQLIAIDGKSLRHSFDTDTDQRPLHLISAWACETGVSLAQLAVDKKSNEIIAVPKLLRSLDIEGHTVSLDAMGCQKRIAQDIHFANANYLLALKANQGNLHKSVIAFFQDAEFIKQQKQKGKLFSIDDSSQRGHGREERRVLLATDAIDWIDEKERKHWLGLKSIICVEAYRTDLKSKHTSIQKRYYLSSHHPDAKVLQKLITQHWRIENQCHWVLDVVWDEDSSRIRKGNAAENVALLRKMALNLLKHDTTVKDTLRGKRLRAAFDEQTLASFLKISIPK